MHSKKLSLFLFFSLSLLSSHTQAKSEKYFLIAPACLLKNIHSPYKILSSTPLLSLVATNNIESFIEAKHIRGKEACGGFMNVSQEWLSTNKNTAAFLKTYEMPPQQHLAGTHYNIQYQQQVNQLLNQLNPQEIWNDLLAFSDTHADQFPDRYQNSVSGARAATWLQNKIRALANENNRHDVTIYTVPSGMKQDSVIVKIGNSDAKGIVIGAHMDTYSYYSSKPKQRGVPPVPDGIKPGADDDGSGCMTVMGIARTLLQSDLRFKKPIYLIWYAAEEFGLTGSQAVVKDFLKKKKMPEAVLQFDMTAYAFRNEDKLWLVTDYVDSDLTSYLARLISTYLKKKESQIGFTQCGYACSDHASWKNKTASAFPFEAELGHDNPYIHTSADTYGILSRDHMTDYAKLGLAFVVELAEPI